MLWSLLEAVRRYFLRGLLAFLPLALTIWILGAVVRAMDGALDFLPAALRPSRYLPFDVPGLGALVTFVSICLIGVLVSHVVGHQLQSWWDRTLRRIPVVRGIYGAVHQLVQTLFSEEMSKFRRVVMIEYPRKGVYTLGLVTGVSVGEVQERTGETVLNVFLPTTPNATSGWYVLVPEKDVIELEMSVEDAFKLIVSGGMVVPEPVAAQNRPPSPGRAAG